jgi:hypothetical protein
MFALTGNEGSQSSSDQYIYAVQEKNDYFVGWLLVGAMSLLSSSKALLVSDRMLTAAEARSQI